MGWVGRLLGVVGVLGAVLLALVVQPSDPTDPARPDVASAASAASSAPRPTDNASSPPDRSAPGSGLRYDVAEGRISAAAGGYYGRAAARRGLRAAVRVASRHTYDPVLLRGDRGLARSDLARWQRDTTAHGDDLLAAAYAVLLDAGSDPADRRTAQDTLWSFGLYRLALGEGQRLAPDRPVFTGLRIHRVRAGLASGYGGQVLAVTMTVTGRLNVDREGSASQIPIVRRARYLMLREDGRWLADDWSATWSAGDPQPVV